MYLLVVWAIWEDFFQRKERAERSVGRILENLVRSRDMPSIVGFIEFDVKFIELELDGDNINIRPLVCDAILQLVQGLTLINSD